MSDLRLQNKPHEVCSELFLWVAHLCKIFAYRIRHTPCAMGCFFGSLTYFRSSLTEQGTRSVYWVISSGRPVMSDLRLQNKAHEVCSKLFLRVAQLCQIFAYRTRHTLCVVSYVFGSLTYRHLCHIFAVWATRRNNLLHTVCALLCRRRSDITERPEEITQYTLRVPCSVNEDLT